MLGILGYIVLGIVVVVWWMFCGSTYHCPNCGRSIERERLNPLAPRCRYSSCPCGWHEDQRDDV